MWQRPFESPIVGPRTLMGGTLTCAGFPAPVVPAHAGIGGAGPEVVDTLLGPEATRRRVIALGAVCFWCGV